MKFKSHIDVSDELLNESSIPHAHNNLTPYELIDVLNDLLNGKISPIEKIDGANLLVGIDNQGKPFFLRNPTDTISNNINDKFPITHPAYQVFSEGFKAISKMLNSLSVEDRINYKLTNKDNTTKRLLNIEIVYGKTPNIIEYADDKNQIVIHSYLGYISDNYLGLAQDKYPTIKEPKLLKELALKMSDTDATSEVPSFLGDIGNVTMVTSLKTTRWTVKPEQIIDKAILKDKLDVLAKVFNNYPEVIQLMNPKDMSEFKTNELMVDLTTKIGSLICSKIESNLFRGSRLVSELHPKIEGLIIDTTKGSFKITGDFTHLNNLYWLPIQQTMQKIKEFNRYILSNVLDIQSISSITKKGWDIYGSNSVNFLVGRNKKVYSAMGKLDEYVIISEIEDVIDNLLDYLRLQYKDVSSNPINVKRENILNFLKIQSYKLQEFRNKINTNKSRKDVLSAFVDVMFGFKSRE